MSLSDATGVGLDGQKGLFGTAPRGQDSSLPQNQFGTTAGGAFIQTNFFFRSYEGFQPGKAQTATAYSPTPPRGRETSSNRLNTRPDHSTLIRFSTRESWLQFGPAESPTNPRYLRDPVSWQQNAANRIDPIAAGSS